MFTKSDIYTTSGSTKLFNSWTSYVSKYDTSSFYNWEQDNLPLYDLEERTYELWEQAGFPTSSVPGFALTVSADTPTATLNADSTIFTTVSSCMAALPKIIRFPILIEIANFGDLGSLDLHNLRMEEEGSLEIINRGYSKVYEASSTVTTVVAAPTYNSWSPLVQEYTSEDVSSTLFNVLGTDTCTSALNLGIATLSAADDSRVTAINSFVYPKLSLRRAPLSVSLGWNGLFTGVANKFKAEPYENVNNTATDNTLLTLDMSATNQATGAAVLRGLIATSQNTGGSLYLNTFKKISVKNCDGPIFIRNFCVDGESGVDTGRDVGIEVTNSDVLLENCAASRCREAGFKFNNSKVVLSRSAFSYRNYKLDTVTSRSNTPGIGFHAINSDVSVSSFLSGTAAQEAANPMAGDFQASGDDVMVIASRNSIGFQLDNSRLVGGFARLFPSNEDSGGILSSELNTSCGIKLTNSQINLEGLIDVYGNDKGIISNLSKVEFTNLCVEDHTNEGVVAKNSEFFLKPMSTVPTNAGETSRKITDFNENGQHLVLQNQSTFDFEKVNHMPIRYGHTSFSGSHGAVSWDTGNACVPAISIEDSSDAKFVHTRIIARDATNSFANIPSYGLGARAIRNSSMTLFGTGSGCSYIWGPDGATYQQKVAGLYASENSEINLHGPTVIAQFGIDALAENQSTINICPPKVKDSWAYDVSGFDLQSQGNHTSVELHSTRACLVVNKNSTLNMLDLGTYNSNWPRTTIGDSIYNAGTDYPIGTFGTSSLIGSGSLQFYPNPNNVAANSESATVTTTVGSIPSLPIFTEKTAMNTFMVNDTIISGTPDFTSRGAISKGGVCVRAVEDSVVNVTNVHFPNGNQNSPLDGIIYNASGTTCDRLMIWNIADTSRFNAAFCSVSGMYPSEAGYHGPSALWGSGEGGSVVGGSREHRIASGAPAGTPDTGTLSVLDSFGAGSSVWVVPSGVSVNQENAYFYPVIQGTGISTIDQLGEVAGRLSQGGMNTSSLATYMYGASAAHTYNNQGLFRIYWSPKSSAKFLQNDASGYDLGTSAPGSFSGNVGPAYQIFSQGYNCSAPLSAMLLEGGGNASSIYPSLLKLSASGVLIAKDNPGVYDKLWTSGFYYCNEFLEDNPQQCMLDESASDTFANSKNASLGSSSRPKKVTLYRSRSDSAGNRGAEAYQGDNHYSVGYKSSNIFDLKRDD